MTAVLAALHTVEHWVLWYFVVAGALWALVFTVVALLDCWRARRVPLDITGQPLPDIRRGVAPRERYQRDEGDETPDIATEGLGAWDPWPGADAIAAVRAAHPKLSEMQAYAVAKARKRLAAHR